jgi:hypothetical protein
MKKLFTLIFLVAFGIVSMQAANYTSSMSGDWSTAATWGGAGVPTAADNVTVVSGHTVTVGTTGSATGATFSCTNLTIDAGGFVTITSAAATKSNILAPKGIFTLNGTLTGATAGNALNRLQAIAGLPFTLTGSGTYVGPYLQIDADMTIDATANLTFSGVGSIQGGTGKSLILNGTLNMTGGGNTFIATAVTINGSTSGTLNISPTVAATSITHSGTFSVKTVAVTMISTISFAFNGTTGIYSFTDLTVNGAAGAASFTLGASTTTSSSFTVSNNFTVNSAGNVNISTNTTVANLVLSSGLVRLTRNPLTAPNTAVLLRINGTLTGGSSTSYIQTDGIANATLGKVRCTNITTSGMTIPLAGTVYAPITITPTATADITMAASGTIGATNCLAAFSPVAVDNEKTVKVQYTLTNNGVGSVTTDLVLAPSSTANGTGYAAITKKAVARSASPWVQLFPSTVTGSTGSVTGEVIPAATTYNYGVTADGGLVATPLAVELTNFQAKASPKATLLTWSTASEKNNAHFNIEQSTNGTDFQTIGQVKGNGTTTAVSNYNFEHTTPAVGVNYYRLNQVDVDGKSTLSAVKSVVFGKTGLVVKNTLVQDAVNVILSEEATTLGIFNMSGQQVMSIKAQGEQRLDVSALPSGLYMMRTATGDVGRFVKQ